ncbi:MAG TPA: tyrosine-type recombinase/integrase [Cellvibrionaceae bacterium]|nr:tyrosine-type recombinase/integrase [Cellvibrionaceae bacterium]
MVELIRAAPIATPAQGDHLVVFKQSECAFDATSDLEAVGYWLQSKANKSINTFISYSKEAYRFLDWLHLHRLTFALVKLNHAEAFMASLTDPDLPARKTTKPRLSKPLAKRLSPEAVNHTRTILGQLFTFLVDAGYLKTNVFKIASKLPVIEKSHQTRYLSLKAWAYLWSFITEQKFTTPEEYREVARTRWLFALLYHSGVRRENVVRGVMGDFVVRDDGWVLRIVGKGRKELFVTVSDALLKELILYRQHLGIPAVPDAADQTPLLPKVRGGSLSPMSLRNVGYIVRGTAERAAAACDDTNIKGQLESMTTHWMRHTNGTHRMLAGASLATTQAEFGHADLKTTLLYAKATNSALRADAEKLGKLV